MKKIRFMILGISLLTTITIKASMNELDNNSTDTIRNIEVPRDLERNLDALLQEWIVNNSKQECSLNNTEPVFYSDSVYIDRLYNLPTDFELVYNSSVKNFIELYAGRRKGQVSYMLGLAQYYFPLFEEALIREGLPTELKYLPIIESALNTTAKSRAGAAGLWQFMPATGKMYGLEVNTRVDERLDPLKSTNAAVKYLKDMYQIYNDWSLVIAAYNCGPGNVNKAIRRSNGSKDYWAIYPYLPKETRGYVPAFIGATYIMSFYDKHNICPSEMTMPLLVDTIKVDKMLHFKQVSEVLNIPIEEIRLLNPQFRTDIVPAGHKTYSLRLPLSNLTAFIDQGDKIYKYKADELFTHRKIKEIEEGIGVGKVHKVRRGETLGAIAAKHGVTTAKLRSLNNLKSDRLSIGQNIIVSNAKPIVLASDNTKQGQGQTTLDVTNELVVIDGELKRKIESASKTTTYYKVVKGDTWNGLVKKTGASIANIKKWNNIKGANIIAGQTIKIISDTTVIDYEDVQRPARIGFNMDDTKNVMATYVDSMVAPSNDFKIPYLIGFNNSGSEENIIDEEYQLEEDSDNLIVLEHQLVYGETLSQIANMYNVSIIDIKRWNHIGSDNEEMNIDSVIIKKTLQEIAADYTAKKNI